MTPILIAMALLAADPLPAADVCKTEFIDMPTGASVADYYPVTAIAEKVTGETEIDCIVAEDLKLGKCIVTEEVPEGYGFGVATIKLAMRKARGVAVDGNGTSCVGRHVRFRFHWVFS